MIISPRALAVISVFKKVATLGHTPPKSDLRNHQAIVQPRLYDSLMVTQITLKTEGPHGLPSGRQTEVDPLYRGLIILAAYSTMAATSVPIGEVVACHAWKVLGLIPLAVVVFI